MVLDHFRIERFIYNCRKMNFLSQKKVDLFFLVSDHGNGDLFLKQKCPPNIFQVQLYHRFALRCAFSQVEALRQAECTVERHAAQELRKAKVEMAETRRQQEILALEMQEAETWKGLIDRLID